MDYNLVIATVLGICILLLFILKVRMHAFISLLIASLIVGLFSGMSVSDILLSMQKGMGDTLGFVALVVGLGAILGSILEKSGGALVLSNFILNKFGINNAPWALMLIGFIIAIPVFFDVAIIILAPILYSLQKRTDKSLLFFGLPLMAGLAVTHAFIPPTPGPVAVAEILSVELGWVILMGFIVGIPVSIICGPLVSRHFANKFFIEGPLNDINEISDSKKSPSFYMVLSIIGVPILLIVVSSMIKAGAFSEHSLNPFIKDALILIGHPFVALILANLLAWYFLGIKLGFNRAQLLEISSKSMSPTGIIILLTGAGGVFKQILVDTGTGTMLAEFFSSLGLSVLIFAYLSALLIRILQGSATVAMITSAGLTAPFLLNDVSSLDKALTVIAIACGATALSHVNDSGFWLVSKYLGMTEKQTLQTWTLLTLILSVSGLSMVLLIASVT